MPCAHLLFAFAFYLTNSVVVISAGSRVILDFIPRQPAYDTLHPWFKITLDFEWCRHCWRIFWDILPVLSGRFSPLQHISHVTDQFACPLLHRIFLASSDGNASCFDIIYGFWVHTCSILVNLMVVYHSYFSNLHLLHQSIFCNAVISTAGTCYHHCRNPFGSGRTSSCHLHFCHLCRPSLW
jgi:hypothetical protein